MGVGLTLAGGGGGGGDPSWVLWAREGQEAARGQRLTSEGRHCCRLAIAGPQDSGDDIVDKALSDAHLEQGLGHRALGHVDEGRLPQRVQQLLHARESVTMGLVLIDPGRHAELEPVCQLTSQPWLPPPGRPSRAALPFHEEGERGGWFLGLSADAGGPPPTIGTVQGGRANCLEPH